nr:IclR family transcriptional regulator C-terminal domain-containing protein [uncultured Hydrogenophaga sp.]
MLSLARGLQVLLAFSERHVPLSVSEIALATSLDRAVVRRCIFTLEQLGMVRGLNRRYVLDANVLSLGHAFFSSSDLVLRAQPLIDALGDSVRTNASLAILNKHDIVYLVRSQSRRLTPHSLGMGSRLPAYCTSLGRVLLSGLPKEELDAYFKQVKLRPRTSYTVTDETRLREALKAARRDGYAAVNQEVELDLIGIAIPVSVTGFHQPLAMSVTVNPRYSTVNEMKARYLPHMQEAARRLAAL